MTEESQHLTYIASMAGALRDVPRHPEERSVSKESGTSQRDRRFNKQ
jgi:hypothetical protein